LHWGFEYQPVPDPIQEAIAEAMLDAGADMIVGHHPHVPQMINVYGDRVVAYSLGNFLFDQGEDERGRGLAIRAFFDSQGLRAVQTLPLHAGLQPRLMTRADAEPWLSQLLPPSPRIGYACTASGCFAAEVPQMDQSGRFYSGRVDLTGDGLPETVRRSGEQITVYEEGTAVWRSPDAWRVVDVALGDPNDDGRYEIMLAIRQKDADGYERSQPYIVGHRGGLYKLLWGGRPVVDPIQELAVADVDGDGSDELIVIEELANGSARALSVWRWAGWTFSLVWRSDYGQYSDLLLLEEEEQPLISIVSVRH
jgi:poly-gamma-glutamate synthesis protein (capsule biosynthesis protein)